MREPSVRRVLRALAAAAAVLLALPGRPPAAHGEDEPAAPRCACAERDACWHFLNAPVQPPDPCPCPECPPGRPHAGTRVPKGWDRACFASKDLACFLRRHAASWRLVCTACEAPHAACGGAHPERCPACGGDAPSPFPKDAAKTAAERLAVESKHFRKEVVAVVGRHAYVVTDAAKVKLQTPSGARLVGTHEFAHVLAQRAEVAYRDFRDRIGAPAVTQPVGVFVPERETTAREVRAAYFRNPRVNMTFGAAGGASQSAVSEGFCLNGVCVPLQAFGGDDLKVHQAVRHLLGNVFFSNWVVQSGETRTTPPWAFEGVAHWLGRLPHALRDEAYWCEGEDNEVGGSPKGWMADVTAAAARGTLRPIAEILGIPTLGRLGYRDQQQAWAWFQVALEDCPRPWLATLRELRLARDPHEAFRKGFGFDAEEFQRRFAARVTGKRANVVDGAAAAPPSASGSSAAPSSDPAAVVARLRAAGPPKDAAGVRAVLDAAARGGDLVRETASVLLGRATEPAAHESIASLGLAHADPIVRAYAARACAALRIASARDRLRALHDDAHWLVRAEAALASASLRDADAQARLRRMLEDASPKARIGATDALRRFDADANPACVPLLVANLAHADWQVRAATCEALGAVGDPRAIGPLVARMGSESARLRHEIRLALRALTGDDLGPGAEAWKAWWAKEEELARRSGGFVKPPPPKDDGRYAAQTPTAFGVEVWTDRIGLILDTSRSTHRVFTPGAATAQRLGLPAGNVSLQRCMAAESARVLRDLPPHARFNAWTFGTDVFRWHRSLQPASPGNVDAAVAFLSAREPDGETNWYGALRAALDLDGGDPFAPGFGDTPDTLTFLTDGSATTGEIPVPDLVVRWFTALNRYARVRVHAVAFGTLDVDETALDTLASSNWGRFRQILEVKPR